MIEDTIAARIVESIKNAILEAIASLDGADADYYTRLYLEFFSNQKKMSELCNLPLEEIQRIIACVDIKKIIPIGLDLINENFQYENFKSTASRRNKAKSQSKGEQVSERDKVSERDLKEEREEQQDQDEAEESDLEEGLEEELKVDLYGMKPRKAARDILKKMLISMIASRMDPTQRAGETEMSNVRNAATYGRQGMISLSSLVNSGAVSVAVLSALRFDGIAPSRMVSVHAIQSKVASALGSIIDVINNEKFTSSPTKVPDKSVGLETLAKVRKSMEIMDEPPLDRGPRAGFTPFAQRAHGKDSGSKGR